MSLCLPVCHYFYMPTESICLKVRSNTKQHNTKAKSKIIFCLKHYLMYETDVDNNYIELSKIVIGLYAFLDIVSPFCSRLEYPY